MSFSETVPIYMAMLLVDFPSLSKYDAAAVFGNAGYESNGFLDLQEIKPVVKGSRGGYGWFQWTADRRVAFEAFCKRKGWQQSSPDANYAFLVRELKTTEKKAIPAMLGAATLYDKVVAFEKAFERAGVKNYKHRLEWANLALDAFEKASAEPAPIPTPSPQPNLLKLLIDFIKSLLSLLPKRPPK